MPDLRRFLVGVPLKKKFSPISFRIRGFFTSLIWDLLWIAFSKQWAWKGYQRQLFSQLPWSRFHYFQFLVFCPWGFQKICKWPRTQLRSQKVNRWGATSTTQVFHLCLRNCVRFFLLPAFWITCKSFLYLWQSFCR